MNDTDNDRSIGESTTVRPGVPDEKLICSDPGSNPGGHTVVTNKQVQSRWTAKILSAGGFVPVSTLFLDNYHRLPTAISASEAMLVVHLMRHKMDERDPFPAVGLLAKRMGLSAGAVRSKLRFLEKSGYVKRKLRTSTSNSYDMTGLFRELEKMAG